MAQITKYTCDHCGKEVADTFSEAGWLKLMGGVTRSWGIRTRKGDGQIDYLSNSSEFCSIACFVGALDKLRGEKGGPRVRETAVTAVDPFPAPAKPRSPVPLALDEDGDAENAVRAYESSIADAENAEGT
jgi:hypothetical protein